MTLILGVNIPRGMAKRSISSPSPDSLSVKRYSAVMIRNTKLRCCDEGPKIPISQQSSFFASEIWHSVDNALAHGTSSCSFFFCRPFFHDAFGRKLRPEFSGTAKSPPHLERNKMRTKAGLRCTLEKPHTFLFSPKLAKQGWEKAVKYSLTLLASCYSVTFMKR